MVLLGVLPNEIISSICSSLQAEAIAGFEFPDLDDVSVPRKAQARSALGALSRTCSLMWTNAQPLLFREVDNLRTLHSLGLFIRTIVEQPLLAAAVRRISLRNLDEPQYVVFHPVSELLRRAFAPFLGQSVTANNYSMGRATPVALIAYLPNLECMHWGGPGDTTAVMSHLPAMLQQTGSARKLRSLTIDTIRPSSGFYLGHIQAILELPALRQLTTIGFVEIIPPRPQRDHAFSAITRLDLFNSFLYFAPFQRIVAACKELHAVHFSTGSWTGPGYLERLSPLQCISALEPHRATIRSLYLEFEAIFHQVSPGWDGQMCIESLRDFTALTCLSIYQRCLISQVSQPFEEQDAEAVVPLLVTILPPSIERLTIWAVDGQLLGAVAQLAKAAPDQTRLRRVVIYALPRSFSAYLALNSFFELACIQYHVEQHPFWEPGLGGARSEFQRRMSLVEIE